MILPINSGPSEALSSSLKYVFGSKNLILISPTGFERAWGALEGSLKYVRVQATPIFDHLGQLNLKKMSFKWPQSSKSYPSLREGSENQPELDLTTFVNDLDQKVEHPRNVFGLCKVLKKFVKIGEVISKGGLD